MSYVVVDFSAEVVEGAADDVVVSVCNNLLLPLALCLLLLSFARLHLYEQCSIEAVGLEQYEVGNACEHAFGFESCACDGIASASIGYGEEVVGEEWVLLLEPPHTGNLYAVFVIGRSFSRGLPLLHAEEIVDGHVYYLLYAMENSRGMKHPTGNILDSSMNDVMVRMRYGESGYFSL